MTIDEYQRQNASNDQGRDQRVWKKLPEPLWTRQGRSVKRRHRHQPHGNRAQQPIPKGCTTREAAYQPQGVSCEQRTVLPDQRNSTNTGKPRQQRNRPDTQRRQSNRRPADQQRSDNKGACRSARESDKRQEPDHAIHCQPEHWRNSWHERTIAGAAHADRFDTDPFGSRIDIDACTGENIRGSEGQRQVSAATRLDWNGKLILRPSLIRGESTDRRIMGCNDHLRLARRALQRIGGPTLSAHRHNERTAPHTDEIDARPLVCPSTASTACVCGEFVTIERVAISSASALARLQKQPVAGPTDENRRIDRRLICEDASQHRQSDDQRQAHIQITQHHLRRRAGGRLPGRWIA
jgi:hypothetical protein